VTMATPIASNVRTAGPARDVNERREFGRSELLFWRIGRIAGLGWMVSAVMELACGFLVDVMQGDFEKLLVGCNWLTPKNPFNFECGLPRPNPS
jgi:hypothetical protein